MMTNSASAAFAAASAVAPPARMPVSYSMKLRNHKTILAAERHEMSDPVLSGFANFADVRGSSDGSGLHIIQRETSTSSTLWRNGEAVTEITDGGIASQAPINAFLANSVFRPARAFFIGRHLSASQHSTFYTLLGNFLTGATAL